MDTKKLRQKILDLAIHGKLVPQDPNDEPASVLLERIRAEKERLIAEGKIKRSKKSATSDTSHYENVPFDVPEGWCWRTLGDIGTWQAGGTPSRMHKEYYGGNIPWLKTGDLNDGIITSIPEYITEEGLKNSSAKLNPTGSILIAMYGATIGRIGILGMPATTNQACCACINNKGVIQKYLFYFLLSHKEEFKALGGGGAQPNISKDIIVKTLIPIPPIKEQERIVSQIDNLLNLLETLDTNKYSLETSITQAKSKILDLAIHGKLVPQDANDEPASVLLKRINPKFVPCDNAHCQYRFPIYWELVKLEDVCEFIRNGVSIRQIKGANGIPITRIETISNGIVDRDRMGYADIIDDTYEKYYLQHGDILMSHINSPIHVGKSALYESIEGEKIIHGMNLLCLRMKTGICPKYMNYLFMSEIFKDEIRPYIKNAVNQASINTRNLGGVYSPIPPYNEQQRIVTKIEELFAVLDEIQKSIEA